MARKFLFLMGIIAAHGVLTAESRSPRIPVFADTCERSPGGPLQFVPPRELLAYVVAPGPEEGAGVGHP